MKQRDLDELKRRRVEQFALSLPFSFIADGESVTLYSCSTKQPALYTDGRTFFEHGTGRPLLYLANDEMTVYRFGNPVATYLARGNFLYSYSDPPGQGPAFYFDDSGQRDQRDAYEKKVQERERLERELQRFDERISPLPQKQQEKQMQSPYRNWLLRLIDFLREN